MQLVEKPLAQNQLKKKGEYILLSPLNQLQVLQMNLG